MAPNPDAELEGILEFEYQWLTSEDQRTGLKEELAKWRNKRFEHCVLPEYTSIHQGKYYKDKVEKLTYADRKKLMECFRQLYTTRTDAALAHVVELVQSRINEAGRSEVLDAFFKKARDQGSRFDTSGPVALVYGRIDKNNGLIRALAEAGSNEAAIDVAQGANVTAGGGGPVVAAKYYRMAYDRGSAEAAFELGFMHQSDHYGMKDLDLARRYYKEATIRGYSRAQSALDSLEKLQKKDAAQARCRNRFELRRHTRRIRAINIGELPPQISLMVL
jgi:TPR repeat protein